MAIMTFHVDAKGFYIHSSKNSWQTAGGVGGGGVRGKFPQVAVEYTGPDRIHQVRPNHKRVCERQRCTPLLYGCSAVLGYKVLSQMN